MVHGVAKNHHPGDKTKSYVCRSDGTFTEKSSLKKIKTRFFGLWSDDRW